MALATALLLGSTIHSPLQGQARPEPNPARFFMKIGAEADFWDVSTDQVRQDVAQWNDLVLISNLSNEPARNLALELRARAVVGNPGLELVRYMNMWGALNPEAVYTDEMFLFENWPDHDPATRGRQVIHAVNGLCDIPELLDISNQALRLEIAAIIGTFIADFDGVYFDRSAWSTFGRQYALGNVALTDGLGCQLPPFDETPFARDFLPQSKEFAVGYHEWVQGVVDPAGDGAKSHYCNDIPRLAQLAEAAYEDRYLAILDGCQIDGTFLNGSVPLLKANWLFHLNTLRKFVSNGRFFLAKVVWDALAEPARTDALEYGFASYLLGADGQYALFQPAYNFTTWATDPIVSAPLGAATGVAALVSGFQPSAYVYGRTFTNGVVYVNAGTGAQSVPVPSGNWRDARRGSRVTKKVTIPSGGARILVKESGKPPPR